MQKARRAALALSFAFLFAGLPAVAMAQTAAPGCNDTNADGTPGGFWRVLKNRADAHRVRDKAYTAMIKPTDSALATTCFDKALALSARMGAMFSDRIPANIPPPNYSAFLTPDLWEGNFDAAQAMDQTYNMFAGLGIDQDGNSRSLANAYGRIMNNAGDSKYGEGGGLLEAYFDPSRGTDPDQLNFAGAISTNLGATVTGALEGYTDIINTYMAGIDTDLRGVWDIQLPASLSFSFTGSFEGAFGWGGFLISYLAPDYMSSINVALDVALTITEMYNYVNTMVGELQNYANSMGPIIADLASQLTDLTSGMMFQAETSMTGYSWDDVVNGVAVDNEGCQFLSQFWNGRRDAGGNIVEPGLKGNGPVPAGDMPFLTFQAFLTGSVGGPEFLAQVNNVENEDIITNAGIDEVYKLGAQYSPYYNPDGVPSWKATPAIQGLGTADIISLMDPPEGP